METSVVRRAVVVAVTERDDPDNELSETQVDQQNIVSLLQNNFGFQPNEISILGDYGRYEDPTWPAVERALEDALEAVHRSENGRFFFFYAGHGTTVSGVEAICLLRKDVTTTQIENVINQFQHWDPKKHNLTWVFDSCHSGSTNRAITTRSRYLPPLNGDTRAIFGSRPQRMLGDVSATTVAFTACAKNESSYGNDSGGFFTQAFVNVARRHPTITNREMLVKITDMILGDKQHPQLTTSVDWENTPFLTPQASRSVRSGRSVESAYRDTYSRDACSRDTRSTRNARPLEPVSRSGFRDTKNIQSSIISGRVFLSGCVASTTSRAAVEIGYLDSPYHPSQDRVVVVALGNGDVSTVRITRDGRLIQIGAASDPVVYLDGVSFAL